MTNSAFVIVICVATIGAALAVPEVSLGSRNF